MGERLNFNISDFNCDDRKYNPIMFGMDIAKIIESEKFITLSRFIEVPITVKLKKIILKEYLLKELIPNKYVQHLKP